MQMHHEFWVTDDPEEAVRKAKITMKKVGTLTRVVPQEHIEGELAFGTHPVALSITWRPETADVQAPGRKEVQAGAATATTDPARATVTDGIGTTLIIEADNPDKSGSAHRSAFERFEDAYRHFDRPDYAPDRLGVLPITIIGIVAALIALILFILFLPRTKKAPGMNYSVADATPAAAAPR